MYSFFWGITWHLNFIYQHFGTLCSIFIGQVDKKSNWDGIARVFIQVKFWLKRSLGQSEGGGMGRGCIPE